MVIPIMQMRKRVLAGEATDPPGVPRTRPHTPGLGADPHLAAGRVETHPGRDSSSVRQGNHPKNIENCLPVCENSFLDTLNIFISSSTLKITK